MSLTETKAGLSMIVREIKGGPPELDPLHFVTVQGESFDATNLGRGDDIVYPWLQTAQMGLEASVGQDTYLAQEIYGDEGTQGWVTLTRNGKEIYRIGVGHGSPVSALRGLWMVDDHWILETNEYLDDASFNGKIIEDGILLNDQNGYEEAFGFQTIGERPFYFFKRKGSINIWYDGQEIPLGYERVPHYGCCSSGELNPRPRRNMVSFFGVRGGTWYFVQIGVPGSF